ncbi:hypothetical protein ACFFGR_05765 [Arthrobacter liuii]|uniref:Uncharacterized protein n=1 Tax=Arthrobacter liuii TaxID=1476996 RepID=A0ABQ2B090_9MICC|nr:hypothetical protein GCM10007170_37970 [Arthrobacter liuii]
MAETLIRWMDGGAPAEISGGTTWGMPFARGTVPGPGSLRMKDAAGNPVASQAWPLATWPDGSLKWAGMALPATGSPSDTYLVTADGGAAPAASQPPSGGASVTVTESADAITVDTGRLQMVINRRGSTLFSSLSRDGRAVARDARLVSLLQDRIHEGAGTARRAAFTGGVTAVALEQSGPVRAVVRLEGNHRPDAPESGRRDWLPFVVRFYFYANARSVRMVHSFIWDGDAERDFLSGLGVRFTVPLEDEPHNRHIRIAGADGGFLTEAVRGLTGLRRDPGTDVREAQIAGRPTPAPDTWNPEVSERLHLIPAWGDYTLTQLSADGFELRKRTAAGHGWVGISGGTRASGFCSLSDTRGGLGIGIRDFWQSHPGQMDIRGAATGEAALTAWLFSPEAQPMDLRFYHDGLGQDTFEEQLEGLEITYEDYEPGFGNPTGIARTHE